MCAAIAQTLGLSKSRIEALTDGIFATLMTVLVLGLALPPPGTSLRDELFGLWNHVLVYAMSFVVLGVYWVGHHNLFHYIKGTNRVFLWLNIMFLMTVGFTPFTTSVLGVFWLQQSAVALYGFNLMLPGLSLYLIWWYATRDHRLVDLDIDPHVVTTVKKRIVTGPVVYGIAIGLSFLEPIMSLILYIVVLAYFILPGHIDIHFSRKHH